ncbi:MAG: Fur family transcriptional regulator [Thermoguttaceae bacterium]
MLKSRLDEAGFVLTPQRELIYVTLLSTTRHPTADQLFEMVRQKSEKVSRMSIFRTLDTFAELGLVRKLEHPGSAIRYDAALDKHYHQLCTECHKVEDVEIEECQPVEIPFSRNPKTGFTLSEVSVLFLGVCQNCQNKKKTIT